MSMRVRRGFTLIELVIALSLLLMIGGLCGVKIGSMVKEHRFNVQLRHFERLIDLAERSAQLLEKPVTLHLSLSTKCLHVEVKGEGDQLNKWFKSKADYSQFHRLIVNQVPLTQGKVLLGHRVCGNGRQELVIQAKHASKSIGKIDSFQLSKIFICGQVTIGKCSPIKKSLR